MTRRWLPPARTSMVVALSIIGSGIIAFQFHRIDSLIDQTNRNRVEAITLTCETTERIKADGRAILRKFGRSRFELPQHSDGSFAFDPLGESCAVRARRIVKPPSE